MLYHAYTLQALENSPEEQQKIESGQVFSDHEGSFLDDFSDEENLFDSEVIKIF